MPYSRNNLATGATITKAALDTMEDGIPEASQAPATSRLVIRA